MDITMNRYILIIIAVLLVFSCKSSKTISKSAQIHEIEQTDQQIETENGIMSLDEMLNAVSLGIGSAPKFNDDTTGVEFRKYVVSKIRYSAEAQMNNIQGHVLVEFFIDTDGSIVNAKVIESAHKLLDAEVLRVTYVRSQVT